MHRHGALPVPVLKNPKLTVSRAEIPSFLRIGGVAPKIVYLGFGIVFASTVVEYE
jgi:hypothetical protein